MDKHLHVLLGSPRDVCKRVQVKGQGSASRQLTAHLVWREPVRWSNCRARPRATTHHPCDHWSWGTQQLDLFSHPIRTSRLLRLCLPSFPSPLLRFLFLSFLFTLVCYSLLRCPAVTAGVVTASHLPARTQYLPSRSRLYHSSWFPPPPKAPAALRHWIPECERFWQSSSAFAVSNFSSL
jgi:hypothetical protein